MARQHGAGAMVMLSSPLIADNLQMLAEATGPVTGSHSTAARASFGSLSTSISIHFAVKSEKSRNTPALRHRFPAITLFPDFARAGGLLAYGPNLLSLLRLSGT